MSSALELILHPPYTATVQGQELRFEIAEPWYRSLPVSCITGLSVSVDGVQVAPEKLSLTIGGVTRTLAECAQAWQDFWFIQDRAVVGVSGVRPQGSVRIAVHLQLRIPYIMVGPTTALPHHAFGEETFEVVA